MELLTVMSTELLITELLAYLSALILGIFAGTQIAEGALMVPQWKALTMEEFYSYHKTFGPKIHKFFAPLTIAATLIPLATAIYYFIIGNPGFKIAIITAVLSLIVLSTFFLYFKNANQQFANQSLSEEELRIELIKWGRWHWVRVILEVVAFLCALMLLL